MEWKTIKTTKIFRWLIERGEMIILIAVGCGLILFICYGLATKANGITLFQIGEHTKNLKHITDHSIKTPERKELKKQIEILGQEKEEKQREIIRQKKSMGVVWHYRENGTLYSRWDKGKLVKGCDWVTPKHIYKYIILGEKYRPLIKDYNWDTLDGENMYICWGAGGFNFKTDANNKGQNKNGSIDWGIMDINDCNLYLFPDKGKGNDKYDMEKSIEVWHKWMVKQNYMSCWQMWKSFRPDVKVLYFSLQKIK